MPWSEDGIELDYSKKFHTTLLVPLRDFIQNGINFTVIKTKHMYVLEDPNAAQNIESKPPASAKSSKSLLIINCHQYLYWFNKFCYVQDAHTLCSKSRELIQDYNLHGCFVRVGRGDCGHPSSVKILHYF